MSISSGTPTPWLRKITTQPYAVLFLLWLVLTAINVNKAFHIDDSFHLEAAQNIAKTPLTPMSGMINWGNYPEPMHRHNQPSLFFYSIAAVGEVFGYSEIPLHLFLSVFTFLALYFFYKICLLVKVQQPNLLLALFAFCPALVINQNLMTDTPILALTLGFTWFLLKAKDTSPLKNYSAAALLLGLGLLIKYSLLPLLVALALVILIRRQFRYLLVILIPLALLGGWSLWNYVEYGSIHILDRPRGEANFNQLMAFMGCLGCVSIVSISFIAGLFPYRLVRWLLYLAMAVAIVSVVRVALNLTSEGKYADQMNDTFIINGYLVCTVFLVAIISGAVRLGFWNFMTSPYFIFTLLALTIGLFMVIFAPFMATRHVLLIIPFILLLTHPLIDKAGSRINGPVLAVTMVLGILLGLSDWHYSAYYRQMAAEINLPKDKTVWATGHWGWQWYSQKNGMQQYHTGQSPVKEGDYFVYPKNICMQSIHADIKLTVVDKLWHEAGPFSFFTVSNYGSMYNSYNDKAPWTLSKNPIDTILICQVELPKDTAQ